MDHAQREQSVGEPKPIPRAVITSDVHFNVNNLALASNVMRTVLDYAEQNELPVIVAGDLHDTKAIVRGECINSLLEIFGDRKIRPFVIVGNHSLLSERGEGHSLNFLAPYCDIVSCPVYIHKLDMHMIPYMSDLQKLNSYLQTVPYGATILCHQGIQGANMGHYVIDKKSMPREAYARFRTISGHFHKSQDIECGVRGPNHVGVFSYIGSPFTHSFAEAEDGPKGFRVLYSDGSLVTVPTNLRRHVVVSWDLSGDQPRDHGAVAQDLVWVKVTGSRSGLDKLTKADVQYVLALPTPNFKLDLIPTDSAPVAPLKAPGVSDGYVLDSLIDGLGETDGRKQQLKTYWRELINESPKS